MKKLTRNEKGFSLIELIIVIAILAVIAAIAVPNLLDNINKSRIQTDVSNAKLVANAVAQQLAENEEYVLDLPLDQVELASDSTEAMVAGAATSMQSVPTIKYLKGAGTAEAAGFYISITTGGSITVYGQASGTAGVDDLFPTVGTDWVLE